MVRSKGHSFRASLSKSVMTGRALFRGAVISVAVMSVVLFFLSTIDGILNGSVYVNYQLGCGMINYAAGFVRRGLYGEVLMLMSGVCQPVIAMILLSSLSFMFILHLFVSRMIKLKISLPYIMALMLSPSLLLMHTNAEFLRTDGVVLALNLSASCILLSLLSKRNKLSSMGGDRATFAGMLVTDAVLILLLASSALIHEMSAALQPAVMLLFFIYAQRNHRTLHFMMVSCLLAGIYIVMMKGYAFADSEAIAESWSGIYGNPDSYRFNDGLLSGTDKIIAMATVRVTRARLVGIDLRLMTDMLMAVAVPSAVLLFSGISIFSSASSRACKARVLLLLLSFCPLGLCIAGNDFGRWYSACALNFAAYALLIAHQSGRAAISSRGPAAADRKIKEAMKQCCLLAVTVILLNFRFDCWGQFLQSEHKFAESLTKSAANISRLADDLKPVIYGDKKIVPHSDYASLPLR